MKTLRHAVALGLAVGLLMSSQASARRTVIDAGEFLPEDTLGTGCTIGGAACSPTILPFSFDFGTGSTNEAFIYDSGIISFGAPILGVDPTGSFTTFGVPVIAPLYVPGTSGVAGPYQVSSGTIEPFLFEETLDNFGTDLFRISFLDPTTIDDEHFLSGIVHVLIDFSATELRVEFIHGMSNTFDPEGVITVLPETDGTQMGFLVAGQQHFESPPDIEKVNAFRIFSTNDVPEPGTWMTMLLGFGLAGFAFRRARARAQLA